MDHVCHIIPLLEKGRYPVLHDFLEKKEIYLALYKELDELWDKHMDKYKPRIEKSVGRYEYLNDLKNIDPYGDQTALYFHDLLIHADLLVARDNEWRHVLLYEEY